MAIFTQTYTNIGLTQLAGTISANYTLSRIAAGSGNQPTPSSATALGIQKIASITVGAATILSPGQYVIQGTIQSSNYAGAPFVLTELGLFGSIPGVNGGAEGLTMYVSVVNGPTIENNTSNPQQTIYLLFNVAVANSANVTVTVGTGLFALESDFVTHLADPAAHPQAFINPFNLAVPTKQGLVPANASPVDVTYSLRGSNPLSWVKTIQTLTANITLFVAIGNPDIFPNFSTIQNALNYLANYFISTGFTATIQVAAGAFNTPFTVNHPQGGQINIIGTATTVTATAAAFASGSVTLTGPFTGFAAGNIVMVSNRQTAAGQEISGCWVVGSATSTTITYATGYGGLGGSLTGTNSITVVRFDTSSTQTTSEAVLFKSDLGLLSNMGFRKTGAAIKDGLVASNNAIVSLNTVGCVGWSVAGGGVAAIASTTGAQVTATNCNCSLNSFGFIAQTGGMTCVNCISNANVIGYSFQQIPLFCTNCISDANSISGFSGSNNGVGTLSGCTAQFSPAGISANLGAIAVQQNGGLFTLNSTDIILAVGAFYVHSGGAGAGIGTVSPNITAANTLTADGCYYSP